MKTWILRLTLVLAACGAIFAQQPPSSLSFEVASIKPSPPQPMGMIRSMMNADAGMIRYTNVSLRDVLRTAYRVKDFQIEGPDWLASERFDITAKFPAGATQDQVPEMLQSLLAERFKLILHRDSKEHAVYALVVGKNGPQLKPAEVQTRDSAAPAGAPGANGGGPATAGTADRDVARTGGPGAPPPPGGPGGAPARGAIMMMMDPSGMHLKAPSMTIANLTDVLSRFTERPIVDMTGIKGQYAFDLVFAPETMRGMPRPGGRMPAPGGERPEGAETQQAEPGASVFDAVQQYGLKLEPRKAPLEILTIDHIEKTPTEN